MALPIRDGNQSLTTLSTLIVNSAHVPAHTVVSLGSQAITDIAQAVSGVELGPNSISALEHISVTISAGTSITIGNVVSVTGGLTNAELRASSVTVGGSVQVSNFPATQTVTFTQASVTFGQAVVSASNIGDILSSVGTDNTADATTKFFKIGGHQDGQNQTSHIVHVSAGGAMKVDASDSTITFGAIGGTVTVENSVTIANFPATQAVTFGQTIVTGSVSVLNLSSITIGQVTVTGGLTNAELRASAVTISGTVTANGGDFASKNTAQPSSAIQLGYMTGGGDFIKVSEDGNCFPVKIFTSDGVVGEANASVPISGTVTVGNSVTIGSLPDIAIGISPVYDSGDDSLNVNIKNIGGGSALSASSSFPVSGTVTANVASIPISAFPSEWISGGDLLKVDLSTIYEVSPATWLQSGGGNVPISGTVTANVLAGQYTTVSQGIVSIGSNSGVVTVSQYPNGALFSLEINTNNSTYKLQKSSATPQFGSPVDIEVTDIFSEAKTTEINTSGETKTYTFKKDHTFNEGYNRLLYVSGSGSTAQYKISTFSDAYWNQTIPVSISSVTIGSLPAISGTVTANPPTYNLLLNTVTAFTFASSGDSPVFSVSQDVGNTWGFSGAFLGGTNNVYKLQEVLGAGGAGGLDVTLYRASDSNITVTTFSSAGPLLVKSGTLPYDNNPNQGDARYFKFVKVSGVAGSSITASVFKASISNYGFPQSIAGTVTVGNSVTIGSLPSISGTVTANLSSTNLNAVTIGVRGTVTVGNTVTIAGVVTSGLTGRGTLGDQYPVGVIYHGESEVLDGGRLSVAITDLDGRAYGDAGNSNFPISGTVTIGAVSTSVTVSQIQGTSVTTSNFTSTTASQTLVSANSARRGLTVFNEGAGNLHICAGATATTLAYQVRLSAGDYWECPSSQTSLTHSAQFASAGTARVVQII